MKYISFKIVAILAIITLSGCGESELDKLPKEQISSATFWTSEKDARLALTGCYSFLNYGYNNVYDDGAADNAYCQYPWESNSTVISAGDIDATLDHGYKSRYASVRQLNYFLENVEKTPMNEDLKKRFVAEAKALRALVYFQLAVTFGPVPLITNSYDDPHETAIAPTPEADVITFVLAELTDAASNLPASYSGGVNNETGRITTGAAWAIKMKVELQYAKWNEAAASAQHVMGLGYQLFRVTSLTADDTKDDYSGFVTFANDAEKEKFYKGLASYEQQFFAANDGKNKEAILVSQSLTNSSYDYGNGLQTLLPPSDLNGWSSIAPTVELVNAYWDKNGNDFIPPTPEQRASNFNNNNPTPAYYDEFKNRDTRLYASILFPSATWERFSAGYKFEWNGGGNNSPIGYNFKKMVDPSFKTSEWDGAQDFPIIRYAEILLSYAEAKNEVSGPDPSIYSALNDIRDRAGMPAVNQALYNTKDKLRQLIRNERRIELAGEGQRFQDIRRWNIADAVMKDVNDINNNITQERHWDPKFMKMPYPQGAVDRNPNLKAAQAEKGY